MIAAPVAQLDPIKYEVFVHRLWAVGEEGRIALQRVSASPIVVQGGECMSSFYDPDGTMILACSGHLRFSAATSDAIKRMIEWYGKSPGFHEGDQIFFNDPYVAGAHTYDQMVVMPIFSQGRLIAWTAASSHTADVGGSLIGSSTEIYHEGIRILGLKVVERGEFREDVFRTIVEQCRDPDYVGLDLKSRIAANNICSRRFLELVDKFGLEFVEAAGQKLIQDAEEQARARLRSLPDGTWRSRVYGTTLEPRTRQALIYQLGCAMAKTGDRLVIDLSDTSPQVPNEMNSTLPNTLAHVTIALTNLLFWDVPWSDGKMRPVEIQVPPGTILNCTYPAACANAPQVGQTLIGAVGDCLGKMLYAGGRYDDVNAGWHGLWYSGGPGFYYGGRNREGIPTAHGLYDIHGGGLGATPTRDGVDTGGHMNIPSAGIADVERQEMQYPFVYFTRRHAPDGSGFGTYRGGLNTERLFMIYGSQDASTDWKPYGPIPRGGFGLFGGYPAGPGGTRAYYAAEGVAERLAAGDYPASPEEVEARWGKPIIPAGAPGRVPLPEYTLLADCVHGGGGYGDPLERDPARVARDVRIGATTADAAERAYGVALRRDGTVDEAKTAARREAVRLARRAGHPPAGRTCAPEVAQAGELRPVLQFHECLEVAAGRDDLYLRCRRCGHVFCTARDNYKRYALEHRRELATFAGRTVPSGEPYLGVFLEYACPGCATLLQVDTYCPSLGGEAPLWDIQLDVEALRCLDP